MLKIILSLSLIISVCACTTLTPLSGKLAYNKIIIDVKPGDRLEILTKDMKKYDLVVEEVDVNEIIGYEEQSQTNELDDEETIEQKNKVLVKVNEIDVLKVKKFSPAKTLGLIAVVHVVLFLIITKNGLNGLGSGDPGHLFLF